MKVLAVDYGSKRVGLASGDTVSKIAFPKAMVKRTPGEAGNEKLVSDLLKICTDEGYRVIVFGLPFDMNNDDGSGRKSNQYFFVKKLMEDFENAAKKEGIEIEICGVDERLSSFEADSVLDDLALATGRPLVRMEHGTGVRDMMAAKVILERYFKEKFN